MDGLADKHINIDLIINKTVSYAQNGMRFLVFIKFRDKNN
jgi:hypothetical protein